MSAAYTQAIGALLQGQDLSHQQAAQVMEEMMEGRLEHARIAALLTALKLKGEQASELTALASVMRGKMKRVSVEGPVLDTCGTGGSGLDTANTSTMTAFVLAADGVKVAKHGNRASSGRCGSSDVLEALGTPIEIPPQQASQLLEEVGLALLFAPLYHPAVRHVVPVRKALGFRTVFNSLGPLCNPAGATLQLLGVSNRAHAPMMASALASMGSQHALVVHGHDGLDELTLTGPSHLWEVRDGQVSHRTLAPQDVGLKPAPFEAIAGGGIETNVRLFEGLLSGKIQGAHRDHLALNAGAALFVAGRARDIAHGVERALALLKDGAPMATFEAYRCQARALLNHGEVAA